MGPEGSRGSLRTTVRCTDAQDCDDSADGSFHSNLNIALLPSWDSVWVELSRSRFSRLSLVQVHTRAFHKQREGLGLRLLFLKLPVGFPLSLL